MRWQRQELVGRRAELDALRRDGAGPALLVVRGPEGSGKTALLRRFRAEAGKIVLDLGGRDGQASWDEFRARALLSAVRAEFETFADAPRVAASIEAVSRLCVPESYSSPARRHRLLATLGVLLARLRGPLVILVDDADDVPVSALAPMHRAGHMVVAACGAGAPRELCSLADRIVDLAPLTDEEVGRLLWQVAAAPVDEAVPRALREQLGSLYGNVGTLVSTVERLWDEGRLAKVHGVLALRSPRAPIALPAGHRLLAEIDAQGALGRTLVALAAGEPEFRIDRIPALAEETGHAAHEYGHAADRLVRAGVLAHEASGRLRCRSRAVAAAAEVPAAQVDDVWQPISAGDYECLAVFVAEAVERGETGEDLAAAAALAAIHLGRPVPEHVRAALADGPVALADRWLAGAEIGVEEFAASFAPLHRRSSLPTIDGWTSRSEESVQDALALRDLVPVFRSVLGPVYGLPVDGPVAAYHRVCRGYIEGDWVDALSAARELELMPTSPPASGASRFDTDRAAARLLAAEICGWRGEDRQAAAWLAAAGEDTAYPGLHGWVATGLRDHAGEDAFAHGWTWYLAHATELEEPGAARLLTRLATIAVDSGDRYRARAVLRETQARYGQASETTLFVRGLVERDGASVRAAERVIRARGSRFELALACQSVARVDGEPQTWLAEAYELARSIGAAKLVSTTKRTMAGCGVAVPVRRTRHSDVSDLERQIIDLIRLGRTNRQIALALRVSAKTVEKHLTRLFAKAGCRTRHALAMSDLGARQELVGA
ncbi:helix-turn-helix transcriptional regulator [Actinophytocola sp.]|uniref:helix-turn-helix transcriptional regulator n=1 Tax=Actinophytocola sp. TaxID=1872138 RepID=UPI002D628901|nr:AAA family ATPase [Actinophytocola sp.]HYQ65956.1 AAA family ATPase [Actinophytocola sp.]